MTATATATAPAPSPAPTCPVSTAGTVELKPDGGTAWIESRVSKTRTYLDICFRASDRPSKPAALRKAAAGTLGTAGGGDPTSRRNTAHVKFYLGAAAKHPDGFTGEIVTLVNAARSSGQLTADEDGEWKHPANKRVLKKAVTLADKIAAAKAAAGDEDQDAAVRAAAAANLEQLAVEAEALATPAVADPYVRAADAVDIDG